MAHVQPECCFFCPFTQVLREDEKRHRGRQPLWQAAHQGHFMALGLGKKKKKSRKRMQKTAGLTSAVQEALLGAGRM